MVCSYSSAVDLTSDELSIDKRIDPATNNSLAAALLQQDYDYAVDEVLEARDEGAQIALVSAHYPGIDETQVLPALVEEIQTMVNLPLALSTSNLVALERALRIYNGCALVDLSSLVPEQREEASALASRYGAIARDAL